MSESCLSCWLIGIHPPFRLVTEIQSQWLERVSGLKSCVLFCQVCRCPTVILDTCWLGIVGNPGVAHYQWQARYGGGDGAPWHSESAVTRLQLGIPRVNPGTEPCLPPLLPHICIGKSPGPQRGEQEQKRGRSGGGDEGWRDQRKAGDGFPVGINEEEESCLINEPSQCLSACPFVPIPAGSTPIATQINPGCCFLSVETVRQTFHLKKERKFSQGSGSVATAGVFPVNIFLYSSRSSFFTHIVPTAVVFYRNVTLQRQWVVDWRRKNWKFCFICLFSCNLVPQWRMG